MKKIILISGAVILAAAIMFILSTHDNKQGVALHGNEAESRSEATESEAAYSSTIGRTARSDSKADLSREIGGYLKAGDYHEVSKALKRMTPEDFPSIWKVFMEHSTTKTPAFFEDLLSRLVGRGAKNGNLDRVLNALHSDLGLGGRRSGLIHSAFHGTSDTAGNDLIEAALRLDIPDERRSALEGFAQHIANLMPWDDVEAISLDSLKPSALKALTDGIGQKVAYSKMLNIGDPVTNTRRTLELSEKFAKFGKNQEFKSNLIRELVMACPDDSWPILKEEGFFSPSRDRRLDDILLKQYYRRRPSEALALMSTLDGFSAKNSYALFDRVISHDLDEASEWYQENSDSLTEDARSGVAAAFAKSGARIGEFETAWEWVESVKDPELRKQAEGEIRAASAEE